MLKVEAKDLTYGGKYYSAVISTLQKYFSSLQDQIEYILANCTMLVYSLCKINGLPYIANSLPNANRLHIVATNGWKAIKYQSGMMLYPNDIVEWGCNHTAYVIEQGTNPQLYASWWTNYDGTSKGRRNATLTKTIKDTIEYFYNKYQFRFFHQTSLVDENNRGGGKANPTYIIRYGQPIQPTIEGVEKDESKDQIYVSTSEQNMRNQPDGEIVGVSQIGYYNVLSTIKTNYVWYEVKENVWVAGVDGRVEFIKAIDVNEAIKDKLKQINKLAKEILDLSN